jgi:two-component system cell cycle sensor histidine kinase/response regulator CckA
VRMIGGMTDLTERRQLEEQLRQSQKMEALGLLAGGIAHDFNNLLSVINGFAELLAQDLPATDPRSTYVSEIIRAGESAAALTRQLLIFSRRQVVAPQTINLNQIVGDLERMLRRIIGEDIELVTRLHPDLGLVRADPGQIEQVLLNLVTNARDAMPQGGTLTIETANVQLDAKAARPFLYATKAHEVRAGRYVLLAVSDTGIGMSPEVQARIFEPFFTTKEPGKGTGLGLATVYGIVMPCGGYVGVYSHPGAGTTFNVYLPQAEAEQPSATAPDDAELVLNGHETILLVEDQDQLRSFAQLALERQGYTVLTAASGDEALHLAETHRGPIHLVITDVVMPRMSGRALAERLTAQRPGLRVLYMSGYTDDAILRHGILEADLPFLQKPFTQTQLVRKVRDVLDAAQG